MPKEVKSDFGVLPKWLQIVVTISFLAYLWYFISSSIVPLSMFIKFPAGFLITAQKMLEFKISIIGFVLCVSVISCAIAIIEFNKESYIKKIMLLDGLSFSLYFLIPIVSTIFVLLSIIFGLVTHLPSANQLIIFLEGQVYFNTFLFSITIITNIVILWILNLDSEIEKIK